MKKFYFLASVLLATMTVNAQLFDFEDLDLAPESYYNGSDGAGGFTSNSAFFPSHYDTEWDYMEGGFAYSNVTDNVTTGYTNQYSAIAGGGGDGSSTYAINFGGGDTIAYSGEYLSMQITNTTYAYFSMKDGDMFSKKFGSPLDANGEEDGTDGKDFFYIQFDLLDQNKEVIYTTDIYLADFRSDNEEEHFILDDWKKIDFPYVGANYFTFSYYSSDMGDFGINTPVYCAIDNISVVVPSGLSKNTLPSFEIYPNPAQNIINIKGNNGNYSITDLSGKTVMNFEVNQMNTVDISTLKSGVYFIRENITSATQKLIVR